MGIRTIGRGLAAALSLAEFAGGANAGGTVRACMIDEPPWGSLAAPQHSIYAEVYAEIAQATGLDLTISIGPLARSFEDVRTGFCQFTITSWQPARAAEMTRGAEFSALEFGVYPRLGYAPLDVASLRGHKIAVPRGLLIVPAFDSDVGISKVEVYGYEQAVRMTAAGRADGAAGSIISLRRIIGRLGVVERFGEPVILNRVPLALQMNQAFAASEDARRIDGAVAELRQSGKAAQIIARYFDEGLLR